MRKTMWKRVSLIARIMQYIKFLLICHTVENKLSGWPFQMLIRRKRGKPGAKNNNNNKKYMKKKL